MGRVLSMMLIASVCFLSACTSDEEKARELGFKDLEEQQYAKSKGFQTKKQLSEYYIKEQEKKDRLKDKLKNHIYCFAKTGKYQSLIMNSSLNNIEKPFLCIGKLELYFTHGYYIDEIKNELSISDEQLRLLANPISDQVKYEFESLAQNGMINFGSARSWSESSCIVEISQRAKERAINSRYCNPDNLESPFR